MPINTMKDPLVRAILRLRQRSDRDRTGMFYTEGVRFIAEAVAANACIEQLVIAPRMLASPYGQKLVRQFRRMGKQVLEVTTEVFEGLSFSEAPQGIGAVLPQRWDTLSSLRPDRALCWVAHETVNSPGNLGTILRTSDAVGGGGAILLGRDVDPYDPSVIRATMGALFTQKFVRAGLKELKQWKQRENVMLVGTSPDAPNDYREICYRGPVVLFMGCERKGLSEDRQAMCDALVRIPMVGRADSLNLAVATGVLLYEVFRQKSNWEAR